MNIFNNILLDQNTIYMFFRASLEGWVEIMSRVEVSRISLPLLPLAEDAHRLLDPCLADLVLCNGGKVINMQGLKVNAI